jgi:hypothetical protein
MRRIDIPSYAPAYLIENLGIPPIDVSKIPWRSAPKFLGDYQYHQSGEAYGRHIVIPENLQAPVQHILDTYREFLEPVIGTQHFNTQFYAKFEVEQEVNSHRDPLNNIGYTLIYVRTKGSAPYTYIGQYKRQNIISLKVEHDCLLALPCSVEANESPKHQGPWHHVDPAPDPRFTIILNTIVG